MEMPTAAIARMVAPALALRRIQKNREAGEDEIAFVTDRGSLAARIDNAAGHAQRAESLSTESN